MGNDSCISQRYRLLIALLVVVSTTGGRCLAQTRVLAPAPANSQSPSPVFEAASIKVSAPNDVTPGGWSRPGGSEFRAMNVSLELLVTMAYGIDISQIQNAPRWLGSRQFYVNAKAPQGVELTREALRPCLQALLQQRFHLKAHHQTVQKKGVALVVADNKSKLALSEGAEFPNFRVNVGPGKLQGKNWSMDFLVLMLAPKVGVPVADKTGLQGRYDVNVEYDDDMSPNPELPSLTTAIQKQLGLKLVPEMVPVVVLVIDGIDELPTEN